jgi:gliding motility-associated-like protein
MIKILLYHSVKKKYRQVLFIFLACLVSIQISAQPSNDNCANAIPYTPTALCNFSTYTTLNATASAGAPAPSCGSYSGGDVWFSTVVPATGHLTFDTQPVTNSSYDASMAIYSGTCGSLTELACDASSSSNGNMPMIDDGALTPGSTVYVRIWTASGGVGEDFGLCIFDPVVPSCLNNTPAGDYCSTAIPMCNLNGYCGNTSGTYGYTVSPTDNTDENGSPLGAIFCGSIENNSWLSFVADATTATLNVFVSNCGLDYGIQVEIYSTMDCYNYTSVSNCFNPGTMVNGTITANNLVIGQTYYIMVDGQAGDICDYVVSAASGVFTIDAGPDVTICPGSSTQLNGSGGNTYSWAPAGSLSNPNIANPVATPSTTTTYTLTVTGGSAQCTGTDVVTVTVAAPTSTAGSNSPICSGQTLNLTSTPAGGNSYSWTGPNGFSSNVQNPTIPNATPADSGTYIVTVTTGGCTSTASTVVSISATPNVTASSNSPICPGTTLNLTSTAGGTTYSWTGPGGFSSAIQNPTITNATPVASGIYTVTITLAGGCSGSDTVNVIINSNLVITATATPSGICPGGSSSLNASSSAPTVLYNWMPVNQSGSTIVVSPSATTTYSVTGTALGCTGTTSVTVTMNSLPVITFAPMPALCVTSPPFNLTQASPPGGTYSGTGVAANTFSPSIAGIGAHTIVYNYTDPATGCSNTDSTQITITTGLTINVTPDNATICPGTNIALTANGATTYVWSPSTGLNQTTGQVVVAQPSTSMVYTVLGSNPDGCQGSATASISFYSTSQVGITAIPASGCSPLDVMFDYAPVNNILDSTWHWNFDDNSSSNNNSVDSSAEHVFQNHGVYTVTFNALDINGCAVTANTIVTAFFTPIADFYYSPDYAYTDYPIIYFKDQSTGALLWNWNFGDPVNPALNYSHLVNPVHSFSDSGTFHVQLIVENNGCFDTTTKDVSIYLNALVFVPNAFTPNDDGKNEIFLPQVTGVDETDYSFIIFDRWGREIFSTNSTKEGWDGKDKSVEAALGVYTYIIQYKEIKGIRHKLKGIVTLCR